MSRLTTWASVHALDTVQGADGRAWTVTSARLGPRWASTGEANVILTLRLANGSEVRTAQPCSAVAPLVARGDHAAEAAACLALLDNGLIFDLLEESYMSDATWMLQGVADHPSGEPMPADATIKRDRYGRYLLPHPTTGAEQAWTRATTVARTLADEYGLTQWKLRTAVKGLSLRPDLIAAASAADVETDKARLQEIAESAMERGGGDAGANFGTALHSFAQRLDQGEPLAAIAPPHPLGADLEAYAALLRSAGLEPVAIEQIVVHPELGIAGTFDRVVSQPPGQAKAGPYAVLDLKTGKDLSYSWLEIAMQLAIYARASHVWSGSSYIPMPDGIDKARGLVLHLPVGKAKAQLYAVDLIKGWEAVQVAVKVRELRSGSRSFAWLVTPDDPAKVALHKVSTAASREALAALWEEYNRRGLWSEEVNAAARTRLAQITELAQAVA